jgi:hypothetical protein
MALQLFIFIWLILSHAIIAQKASACSNARTRKADPLGRAKPDALVTKGFTARLVNDELLARPRGMVFDKRGRLLVVENGKGISALKLNYEGGACVSSTEKPTLVHGDISVCCLTVSSLIDYRYEIIQRADSLAAQ